MEAEDYRDRRDEQQLRRAKRLPIRQKEIEDLSALGYEVKKLNEGYCYRINGIYDIYPIHHRWHHLKSNNRGNYTPFKLEGFIKQKIPL